jgi:3-deoxy-D-manno-octulosonic acid kinase
VSAAILRGTRWAILYDPALLSDPTPALFEPASWAGRVAGRAPRGRGWVMFVRAGQQQWALRHYRRGGVAGRVLVDRFLWLGESLSRSFREWRMLARLHAAGLPVPQPVAAGWRRRGLSYVADLATIRIPAATPLSERLAAGTVVDWPAIGRVLRDFHSAGACHADLNAHNILIDAAGQAWVLDFDRGRFRPPGAWQAGNLARLRRSLDSVAREPGTPAFSEAGWEALLAGYQAERDLRRASGP